MALPVVWERTARGLQYRVAVVRRPEGDFLVQVQHLDDEDIPGMGHIEIWGNKGGAVTAATQAEAIAIAKKMLRDAVKERWGEDALTDGIRTITLPLPYRMGKVNCYLVKTDGGFVLIDTGPSKGRATLERTLTGAGCRPGSLRAIILTHGDFDHTGNAAYLRSKLGAPIAMHGGDAGMAERGDMFWGRRSGNGLIRALAPALFRFAKSDRFTPDVSVEDGFDFAAHGFPAKAVALPGHSSGSLGILTADADLFCGDLLDNTKRPALNSIMDDVEGGKNSVERLRGMTIRAVYPGHGGPFTMDDLGKP